MSDAPERIWVHVGTGEVSLEKPERHWEFQDFDTIQDALTAARIEGARMATEASVVTASRKSLIERCRRQADLLEQHFMEYNSAPVLEFSVRAMRDMIDAIDPERIVKGGDT